MKRIIFRILVTVFCLGMLSVFSACEEQGPAERVGEQLDEATEETREGIEEAGEEMKEAVEETGEELQEAGENMQN